MSQNRAFQVLWALLLIGAGVLGLIYGWGPIAGLGAAAWGLLLLAAGVIFLAGYAIDRSQWWPLIPGSALMGVGLLIVLGTLHLLSSTWLPSLLFLCLAAGFAGVYLAQRSENWWAIIPAAAMLLIALMIPTASYSGDLAAVVFFGGLGLAFLAVFFARASGQDNWWALIPAGALISLAAVVGLSRYDEGTAGASLFLGLGVTFGLLYLLRSPVRPLGWAWIPALATGGLGAFVLLVGGSTTISRSLGALLVIAAGCGVLIWGRHRGTSRL